MGRPRLPNNKKAYKGLSRRLAGYMLQVRNIYDRLNEKVASLVESVGYDGSTEFFFADFPEVKRDLLLLQRQFVGEMQTLIYSGTSVEWKNSNIFQDLVANKALKYYRAQVSGERFKHYFDSNSDQLKAFQARKDKGLNLSTKLWKQADIYKESLEATISTAIEKGMSASTLSKRISRYLKDWPSLQADYQERYAKATRCHDCEYNSIRLARNEISMAYRTAEQLRWQKFDFILGYKIKLSDSHPRYDICDDLAGDYPKDFKFRSWHPNCYSDDTQVLTNYGWRLFKDVHWEDMILSLNPSTYNIEWVGIDDMQEYESNGKMYHFFNKTLDCLVTPDHKMVYLNKSDGRIKYCLAKDYTKGKGAFYRGCEYVAGDTDAIDIEGKKYSFDLFCEFMGYYLSDGSLQHKTGIIISQKDGQPYKYMIVDCIKNMGFAPRVKEEMIEFYNAPLNRYLTQFGIARKKFIPTIIKNASKRQIQIFLDAFIKCDGYVRNIRKSFVGSHGNIFVPKLEEKMYFTTSPQMASDLSELILKSGKRPSFRVQKPTDARKKDGTIIHGNFDCWIISECKSLTSTDFKKEEVSYKGKVYDLTLKRNHIMYVRRNGKCFWGSNCLCFTVPIVMSEEEYWSDNREDSPNKIITPPENFSKWLSNNSKRVNDAIERKTLPYWVRDNNIDKAVLLLGDNKDLYNSANWGLLSRSLNDSNIGFVVSSNKKLNKLLDDRVPPINHTSQMVVPVNGSDFKSAISAEKIRNKRGWMVDVHDDYSSMKCFLTSDGKSGIAVTRDGDIISVFSSVAGDKRLEKLIPIAIENGGIKCDCYGGGLQNIYARYGAIATGKVPFNKDYAPSDWDGKSEFPVVAMKFPESIDKSIKHYNRNVSIDIEKVKTFDDYEKMLLDRDKRLKL